MSELNWTVLYTADGTDEIVSGVSELHLGENHIVCDLPAC